MEKKVYEKRLEKTCLICNQGFLTSNHKAHRCKKCEQEKLWRFVCQICLVEEIKVSSIDWKPKDWSCGLCREKIRLEKFKRIQKGERVSHSLVCKRCSASFTSFSANQLICDLCRGCFCKHCGIRIENWTAQSGRCFCNEHRYVSRNLPPRKCPGCGVNFLPQTGNQLHCKVACRDKRYSDTRNLFVPRQLKKTITCGICQTEFNGRISSKHLKMHNMPTKEYLEKFDSLYSEATRWKIGTQVLQREFQAISRLSRILRSVLLENNFTDFDLEYPVEITRNGVQKIHPFDLRIGDKLVEIDGCRYHACIECGFKEKWFVKAAEIESEWRRPLEENGKLVVIKEHEMHLNLDSVIEKLGLTRTRHYDFDIEYEKVRSEEKFDPLNWVEKYREIHLRSLWKKWELFFLRPSKEIFNKAIDIVEDWMKDLLERGFLIQDRRLLLSGYTKEHFKKAIGRFVQPRFLPQEEIDITQLDPILEEVLTEEQRKIFNQVIERWSVPVTSTYWKYTKVLILDRKTRLVIGVIGLGSMPFARMKALDQYVGWDEKTTGMNGKHLWQVFICGASEKVAHYKLGKFVAMCLFASELQKILLRKYQDQPFAAVLLSAFGKSSVYKNIKIFPDGSRSLIPIGFTEGYGTAHVSETILDRISALLKELGVKVIGKYLMFQTFLELTNLPREWARHGVSRQIFFVPWVQDVKNILCSDNEEVRKNAKPTCYPIEFLYQQFLKRWGGKV